MIASPGARTAAAFTLLELLVVLAMICLLLSVVRTALAMNRTGTNGLQCLNNHRQLIADWKMYADDSQGRLVYNQDGQTAGKAAGNESWVAGWLDYSASSDNTNTQYLVRHDLLPYGAYLGAYVKSASLFKCPADKSTTSLGAPRVRSISMNSFFGEKARSWTSPSSYIVHANLAQIKSPATQYVLLDELESSINDGCFFADPDTTYRLIDYPAFHHDSGGTFSFADGHGEIHRWVDARTMPPGQSVQLNVNLPGDVDVVWLQQHASELK
jgi:prepilin-type N-terminal cleavage/methylation domain-containing protein